MQDTINNTEEASCKVSIDCPVRKNPLKHAKSLTVTRKIEIYHFFDYESDEPIHVKGFQEALDNMKKAEKIGKQIKYRSGYSNFTFDLWIILHMTNCNASFSHRKQYVTPINRTFGEKFQNMDEFKEENNFKRCLNKMDLSNVIVAIDRAKFESTYPDREFVQQAVAQIPSMEDIQINGADTIYIIYRIGQ